MRMRVEEFARYWGHVRNRTLKVAELVPAGESGRPGDRVRQDLDAVRADAPPDGQRTER